MTNPNRRSAKTTPTRAGRSFIAELKATRRERELDKLLEELQAEVDAMRATMKEALDAIRELATAAKTRKGPEGNSGE